VILDPETLSVEHVLPAPGTKHADVTAVACHGIYALAATTVGMVHFFDLQQRRHLTSVKAHASAIGGISVSSDGLLLATAAHDRALRIWELHLSPSQPTVALKQELNLHRAVWGAVFAQVAFRPTGAPQLATAGADGAIGIVGTN
jgi:WD40 repeat protein